MLHSGGEFFIVDIAGGLDGTAKADSTTLAVTPLANLVSTSRRSEPGIVDDSPSSPNAIGVKLLTLCPNS